MLHSSQLAALLGIGYREGSHEVAMVNHLQATHGQYIQTRMTGWTSTAACLACAFLCAGQRATTEGCRQRISLSMSLVHSTWTPLVALQVGAAGRDGGRGRPAEHAGEPADVLGRGPRLHGRGAAPRAAAVAHGARRCPRGAGSSFETA